MPNLVLARVGAGGKIRIYNWWGPTHMVADVAGWFDTGGTQRQRLGIHGRHSKPACFDSRNDIDTTAAPFVADETRSVQVAGRAGVPSNATSVVVNITVTEPQGSGFATAFPTGRRASGCLQPQLRRGDDAGQPRRREGRHRRAESRSTRPRHRHT